MTDILFGIRAAITGITIVFFVLTALSTVMFLLEKFLGEMTEGKTEGEKEKKIENQEKEERSTKSEEELTDQEKVAAITAIKTFKEQKKLTSKELKAVLGAIFAYRREKFPILKIKTSRNWKLEGRRKNLEN